MGVLKRKIEFEERQITPETLEISWYNAEFRLNQISKVQRERTQKIINK